MNPASAALDFDEINDEDSSPIVRQKHHFYPGTLGAACGRLAAQQATSRVHEWYNQLEHNRAEFSRLLEAAKEVLEIFRAEALDRELKDLAIEWKETRQRASSSVLKWVMHPAYQRIIGKGKEAIPFVLRELEREPDHWFWALNAITGEDPVKEEDRGDIAAMSRAWILWGRQSGYI